MPIIYLSPSTQENNLYVSGGSEEYWMNRLADAMAPYLDASGIRYVRNDPGMTAASSIAASNRGSYDLHLALHSNAAPEGRYGEVRGVLVFYYPGSVKGRRAAEIVTENLKRIYPIPSLVRTEATTTIGEVRKVRAPSVFLELGYHDNPDDAAWVKSQLDLIAQNLVGSLCQYFGIPFLSPASPLPALVDTEGSALNIRRRPSLSAPVTARAHDGAYLTVVNRWEGWYLVRYGCLTGYASADYVTLL